MFFELYFFPGYSLYFFLIFSHLWWFWVWGLGSFIGFLGVGCSVYRVFCGWGFQFMGFGACGVEPSGYFGYGALYINIKE